MNWLATIFQSLITAIASVVSRKPAEAEPPADYPPGPNFGKIDAAEDARLERERSSRDPGALPVILPPRTPLASDANDRATDVDAMRPDDSEPEPSTRRP